MTRKEIIVAVVLAVVCAPFGEVILHLLSAGAQFVGRVSTLGITTVVDAQYAIAARTMGHPSTVPALINVAFCCGVSLSLVFLTMVSISSRSWLSAPAYTSFRQSVSRVSLVGVVFVVPILISGCQSLYAVQLAKAFERRAILAAPYLTERERLELQAQFVLVESKLQYESVMAKLDRALAARKS